MSATVTAQEWLAPGRKTIRGYLSPSKGPWKKRYGLFEGLVAAIAEEHGATLPRYPDLHAVWFGVDPEKPESHRLVRPFLRYRRAQPIPGLRTECRHHLVEITCTVGEAWSNGLGAYITRAEGRCLDCGDEAT